MSWRTTEAAVVEVEAVEVEEREELEAEVLEVEADVVETHEEWKNGRRRSLVSSHVSFQALSEVEAEVQRLAHNEGLSLVTADNSTGYKGVCKSHGKFQAQCYQEGRSECLGSFSSAAEAALAYARHLGPAGCAAATAPPAATQPAVTEAEARQLAAAEGLQLVILDAVPVSGVKRARVW